MAFRDWQDTALADPLRLPIPDRDGNRREYVIPPLGYLDAIRLNEEMDRIAKGEPPQIVGDEYQRILLGGQLTKMRADNVPPDAITHAANVAHMDAVNGRDAAEKLWNEGPDPELLAAAEKMAAAARDGSTISPDTPPPARTSSTKRPASTASTGSRSKASKSAGRTSSPSQS